MGSFPPTAVSAVGTLSWYIYIGVSAAALVPFSLPLSPPYLLSLIHLQLSSLDIYLNPEDNTIQVNSFIIYTPFSLNTLLPAPWTRDQ